MTSRFSIRTGTALLALLGSSPLLHAQTVYASSGPPALAVEFTAAPAGPCGYPNGPGIGAFPTGALFGCPLPGPVFAGLLGDIAVNDVANTVWVTDGLILGEYTPAGVPVRGFALAPGFILPGALTGLGFGGGILWITDGAFLAGIIPPAAPGCPGVPALAVPAWPSPLPPGMGVITDVDFAPAAGTLWVCTAGGAVANIPAGPGPMIVAFPPAACPLAIPLTGIAVDHATPTVGGGPLCLYVSDGAAVAYITPVTLGGPGPLKFYRTAACFPNLAAPSTGLSSSLHAITYGAGFDPAGPPFPVIGSVGQSTVPSATFGITLAMASPAPGTIAALFIDIASLCPTIPFKGNPLYCLNFLMLGPFPVAGGALALPLPLPGGLPIGVSVYSQWVIRKGPAPAPYQVSGGLEFTFGMP